MNREKFNELELKFYRVKNKISIAIKSFIRHLNKNHLKMVLKCWESDAWDEGFLYDVELAKINEMIYYFERSNIVDTTYILRDLKICRTLLDIILENDVYCCLYKMDIEKINYRNIKRIYPEMKYMEQDRFNEVMNIAKINYDEYYKAKAKHLYHKIRAYRDCSWWD